MQLTFKNVRLKVQIYTVRGPTIKFENGYNSGINVNEKKLIIVFLITHETFFLSTKSLIQIFKLKKIDTPK